MPCKMSLVHGSYLYPLRRYCFGHGNAGNLRCVTVNSNPTLDSATSNALIHTVRCFRFNGRRGSIVFSYWLDTEHRACVAHLKSRHDGGVGLSDGRSTLCGEHIALRFGDNMNFTHFAHQHRTIEGEKRFIYEHYTIRFSLRHDLD